AWGHEDALARRLRMSRAAVADAFERAIVRHGRPQSITVDHGTELACRRNVWHSTSPGLKSPRITITSTRACSRYPSASAASAKHRNAVNRYRVGINMSKNAF